MMHIHIVLSQMTQPSTLLASSSKFSEIWNSENPKAGSKWRRQASPVRLWGPALSFSAVYLCAGATTASHTPFCFWLPTAIVEHNLNSKIWNNGYGNRNCNVQWRKEPDDLVWKQQMVPDKDAAASLQRARWKIFDQTQIPCTFRSNFSFPV